MPDARHDQQTRKFGKGERVPPEQRVNINTASREELTRLYRIGDDLADEIVRYRNEHGPFRRPEDIQNVPGIGPDWFREDAGEQITV